MNIRQLCKQSVKRLEEKHFDDCDFQIKQLIMHYFKLSKTSYYSAKSNDVSDIQINDFNRLLNRLIAGEPLQYIMGRWEFMGLSFIVGSGVLIPRPETELITEKAITFVGKEKMNVFDLCSGTGCIGISIAKFCPNAAVYLFEKSDEAFSYLQKNISLNGVENASAIKWDIFNEYKSEIKADVIVSNPPYIAENEIPSLQLQVGFEPETALNGGADGLNFYKTIAEKWSPVLKENGLLAVEHGDNQGIDVKNIFAPYFYNIELHNDLSSIDRAVTAYKK